MLCVYQFKVVLRGISPMIWRRLLLRSDHSIADLHYTIQIAMGWSDAHLNRFHIHGKDYGVAHEGGLTFSDDPERVLLGQFGFRLRERFLYEYDFYGRWEHNIRLEKVLPLNSKHVLPVCIGGQRLAPPEDCGGARAYMEEGDPRWRTWSDAMPREDLRLIAETVNASLIRAEIAPSSVIERVSYPPWIGSKLIVICGRTELTGAPSIDGFDNMLVVKRAPTGGCRSDPPGGQEAAWSNPAENGRAANRGIPGNSTWLPTLWESPRAERQPYGDVPDSVRQPRAP